MRPDHENRRDHDRADPPRRGAPPGSGPHRAVRPATCRDHARSLAARLRWDLRIHGDGARTFHVQASLATLEAPLTPCAVEWSGRELPAEEWSHDASTGVLRVSVTG